MKLLVSIALCSALLNVANGFVVVTPKSTHTTPLFDSVTRTKEPLPGDQKKITSASKESLLRVATNLKDKFGVFIVDSKAKQDLRSSVDDLEAVSERPSFDDAAMKNFMGNWTLVCTTASSSSLPSPLGDGIDTSKVPFFDNPLRKSLNRQLEVVQVIKGDGEKITRVDNVLEFSPPKKLSDVFDNVPQQLQTFNLNPLDVTKSKVALVHDAEVESTGPSFRTKLKLASVVWNVAGKSQNMDPKGQDVLGVNVPFKEFQAGTFETTYLDKTMRISRGKVGAVEHLRVFVRSEEMEEDDMEEGTTEELEDVEMEAGDEVDDFEVEVDPGFET